MTSQDLKNLFNQAKRAGQATYTLLPEDDWVDTVAMIQANCIKENSTNPNSKLRATTHGNRVILTCQKNDVDAELTPMYLPPKSSGQPKELSESEAQILRESLPPTQGWREEPLNPQNEE